MLLPRRPRISHGWPFCARAKGRISRDLMSFVLSCLIKCLPMASLRIVGVCTARLTINVRNSESHRRMHIAGYTSRSSNGAMIRVNSHHQHGHSILYAEEAVRMRRSFYVCGGRRGCRIKITDRYKSTETWENKSHRYRHTECIEVQLYRSECAQWAATTVAKHRTAKHIININVRGSFASHWFVAQAAAAAANSITNNLNW